MNPISPRVSNGLGAAGGSAPIAIILIWAIGLILGHWQIQVPPEIAGAMGSLFSAAAGFLGGYLTRLEAGPIAPVPVQAPQAPSAPVIPPPAVPPVPIPPAS
ncbi:hypothetical protein, partial [Aquabacterium sp.]|uniref:hypothetical protein n=1 Tax=Aquabacterium sp. TaxID=1872578 RepID=UPI0025B980DF